MNNSDIEVGFKHTPVLLAEALLNLNVKTDSWYIDGTIGGGGHTQGILKSGGKVLGIDQDREAILHLKKKFEKEINSGRLVLFCGNFADMGQIAETAGIENVDGVLLDLGLSSFQLDDSGRGFSFQRNEPLDMRMSGETGLTAGEIVNKWSENELYNIFAKYGEEIASRKLAAEIVKARSLGPIITTDDLVRIVTKVVRGGGIHPATRVFQALRIAVNDEIENLRSGLMSGFKLLNKGARFAVISFHSLEDRTVKLNFLHFERQGSGRILTKKPVLPEESEIRNNRRARSAKLRVIEKI